MEDSFPVAMSATRPLPGSAASSSGAPPPEPGPPPRLVRLPALDGLRGAAVLAVMAFHFGVPGVVGGYLGVDVFFVLSGFLITSLLVVEWQRRGQISVRRFWGRRARRLVPGLVVVLAGIAVWTALTHPADAGSTRGDAVATLSYIANWRYVFAHRGYFAQYAAPSPLAHTWSLAIEEQFYLVWPLLALPILARWGVRALRNVAVAGAMASAGLCLALFALGANTARIYYGTDTRCQAILIGAALATACALRPAANTPRREWTAAAAIGAGVLLAGCHWLAGTDSALYAGGFTVIGLAAAAVIGGVASGAGGVARALSPRVLRGAGAMSYELYLWHWPVLVALTATQTGLHGLGLLTARAGTTVVLAAATWGLVDRPIHDGRWRLPRRSAARISVLAGVAAVMVAVVALIGAAVPPSTAVPVRLAGVTASPTRPTVHAVLLGDSVAMTLGIGLLDEQRAYGVDVIDGGLLGCGILGAGEIIVGGVAAQVVRGCANWEIGWQDLVAQQQPSVVAILVGRWEEVDRKLDGRWEHVGEPQFDAFVSAQLNQAIDAAGSTGARVLVMTSPHFLGVERPDGGRWPENDPQRVDAFNALVRAAVARHGRRVSLFDLDAHADPSGQYRASLDGVTARMPDGVHFTRPGADLLAPPILAAMVRLSGVLGRPAAGG
jgi:peptidoglycan/LPS O-acetylase OafA/YrhL